MGSSPPAEVDPLKECDDFFTQQFAIADEARKIEQEEKDGQKISSKEKQERFRRAGGG